MYVLRYFVFILCLYSIGMFRFIRDFFLFPFAPRRQDNVFRQWLQFILRDYPVYFWVKPKIWKFFAFPFFAIYKIFVHEKKESPAK